MMSYAWKMLFVLSICYVIGADQVYADVPMHHVAQEGVIREWIVLGPFPGKRVDERRMGLEIEFLEDEAQATLAPDMTVDGMETMAVQTSESGMVDLMKLLGPVENTVAYGFTQLYAPDACEIGVFFGTDDWAKIWLNGELVFHHYADMGRPFRMRDEQMRWNLKPGVNTVLFKVEQDTGPWGFGLEVLSIESQQKLLEEQTRHEALRRFMYVSAVPATPGDWILWGDEFPKIRWSDPEIAKATLGDAPMTVRWFNADWEEVSEPDEPGRYGCYVESAMPDGSPVRRAMTFYRPGPDFRPWHVRDRALVEVHPPFLDALDIRSELAEPYSAYLQQQITASAAYGLLNSQAGAIFMAGMHEAATDDANRDIMQLDWPETRDQDWHLALKQRILGLDAEGVHPLDPPRSRADNPAPVLQYGDAVAAGMDAEMVEKARALAQKWADETGLGFNLLAARNGVVFIHESFGDQHALDAKLPTASYTKMVTGLLFARFLDQERFDLDDPIGLYLPDFPTEGDHVITLRHAMHHVAGLWGHGQWDGMRNPWLDNVVRNGLETLSPGMRFEYDGDGMNLAGKAMEIMTGKSIFRLLHEDLYMPLGLDNPVQSDLGFGKNCTVMDMGIIGQLILNRGAYGDQELFSEEIFQHLIPWPYERYFPAITDAPFEFGLGMMRWPDSEQYEGESIFGPHAIGRGGASGAWLMVDLDTDLIIAMARSSMGEEYYGYLNPIMGTLARGMIE